MTVPADRGDDAVPKYRLSACVVVVVPEREAVPAELVDHPCVELFVVGAAQVQPAVPKPAVELFVSK